MTTFWNVFRRGEGEIEDSPVGKSDKENDYIRCGLKSVNASVFIQWKLCIRIDKWEELSKERT